MTDISIRNASLVLKRNDFTRAKGFKPSYFWEET